MKNAAHIVRAMVLAVITLLFCGLLHAQDAAPTVNIKPPKHYFKTLIVVEGYGKRDRKIPDTSEALSRRLKTYGIKETDISFCAPLGTFEDWRDSLTISNSHLLLTGNYTALRPVFNGIAQHRLVKIGIGLRYIYNTGKKGVWFMDVAPFVTRDATFKSKGYLRLASTFVYSHNISEYVNWRLGITKSFLWGNRFYWPFIGLRVGKLDKFNLSIQFPRSINLNMPLNSKLILSLYTKPQGGMYNFSNRDSLYFKKTEAAFNFTRYEINTGLRFDVRVSDGFNFYVAGGISSGNSVTFYSESANKKRPRAPYRTYFYTQKMSPGLYLNFGLVFKFGKTRSYYNDRNLYDAMNLSGISNNDGNALIPITPRKKSDLNLESIKDLVDYNDF